MEAEKETKARIAALYQKNLEREGLCTCAQNVLPAIASSYSPSQPSILVRIFMHACVLSALISVCACSNVTHRDSYAFFRIHQAKTTCTNVRHALHYH